MFLPSGLEVFFFFKFGFILRLFRFATLKYRIPLKFISTKLKLQQILLNFKKMGRIYKIKMTYSGRWLSVLAVEALRILQRLVPAPGPRNACVRALISSSRRIGPLSVRSRSIVRTIPLSRITGHGSGGSTSWCHLKKDNFH